MDNKFNHLTTEQSNLIILKALCILEEKKYSQLANWPFEDISIDDIFNQIQSFDWISLIVGFAVAAITGYLSIVLLIRLIDKSHFWKFSLYVGLASCIINYYV